MRTVKFAVKRSEDGKTFRSQEYFVLVDRKGMTVLDGLFWLVDNHEDPPAFRYTCRSAVCGSCAMRINGKNRLACKTQIGTLGDSVKIEPLTGFPVIRDLVVDMEPFFERNASVHPYLITLAQAPEKEYVQSVEQRKAIDEPTICIMCAACTGACPTFLTDDRFIGPAALLKDFRFYADSRTEDRRPYLETAGGRDGAWRCCTCKNCPEVCPKQIRLVDHFIDFREELMMECLVECKLPAVLQNYQRYGNSFGLSERARAKWTDGLPFNVKDARKEKVDYLWFVGDYASYDVRVVEVTRKFAAVLHGHGVDFGITYEDERNSGNDVLRMGEEGLFESLADSNIRLLSRCKYNHIVTTDPHTYNALKNDYAFFMDYAKDTKVIHYTELLAHLMDNGKLKFTKKIQGKVTYHDPCYLGRYNNLYDAPRKILRAVCEEFSEMDRMRENSFCCGAGGGKIWMEDIPGIKERPSEVRIKEALGTNAQIFVVACPKDYVMFQDAVKTLGCQDRIVIKDIAELVCEAL